MTKVLIIGSPNSGKSLLFNKLTGLHQKVANYPGITVDICSGQSQANPEIKLIDHPGIYSLLSISDEERIAIKAFKQSLLSDDVGGVIYILDATRLDKGLYLGLQILQECHKAGKPIIFVANMIDTLKKHNIVFNHHDLSQALGIPVVAASAKTGEGLGELKSFLKEHFSSKNDLCPSTEMLNQSEMRARANQLSREFGVKGDLLVRTQSKLDTFFLHSFFGGATFFLIMYLLFQSIFTWASPAMDAVEGVLEAIATFVLPLVPMGVARDFMSDALFGGVGAFLVFVPQIFVLTFVVGLLEDSGYLARAAVICHRPLTWFGLTGKSFVPMLSGVACAIPGIYAARTIDSPYRRWLTYLAIPLMPCSARLPVYTLLIAAFIPATNLFGGLVGLQGLAMFVLYFFGIFCGLLVTAMLSKARPRFCEDLPFVLEMPPYRLPSWLPLVRNSWNRSKHFVTKAGSIIFTVSVVVWFLGYFPNYGADLGESWLGSIGKFIEPVFSPLGLDWRYGVAILSSFLAREVFVGTLGTLIGIESADEHVTRLADVIQTSGLSLGSGLALLVFFAIAMQCVSTLAILQKESGSWKLPTQMFVGYSISAYLFAWLTYQAVLS